MGTWFLSVSEQGVEGLSCPRRFRRLRGGATFSKYKIVAEVGSIFFSYSLRDSLPAFPMRSGIVEATIETDVQFFTAVGTLTTTIDCFGVFHLCSAVVTLSHTPIIPDSCILVADAIYRTTNLRRCLETQASAKCPPVYGTRHKASPYRLLLCGRRVRP